MFDNLRICKPPSIQLAVVVCIFIGFFRCLNECIPIPVVFFHIILKRLDAKLIQERPIVENALNQVALVFCERIAFALISKEFACSLLIEHFRVFRILVDRQSKSCLTNVGIV